MQTGVLCAHKCAIITRHCQWGTFVLELFSVNSVYTKDLPKPIQGLRMSFDSKAFSREVGLILQVARKKRGLTQQELAAAIGIPRATYANLESGRQRAPLDIVWRASLVLGVPLTSLVPEALPRAASEPTQDEVLGTGTDLAALTQSLTAV